MNAGSVFIATPIHEAVLKGNPEIVQRLIAAGKVFLKVSEAAPF